jgi:hypothetical protein
MFGLKRMQQLKQMADNPHESEMAHALASIVANYEHDLLRAVEDLHDALDVDDPVEVDATPDERVNHLLDLADAAGDGDLKTFWFEEVADLKNAEEAAEFAGLTGEAWREQVTEWSEMYRERRPEIFEDWGDREIADYHVEGEFGVAIEEFEREVVGWSRRGALKSALAGNIAVGIDGVKRATAAARDGGASA